MNGKRAFFWVTRFPNRVFYKLVCGLLYYKQVFLYSGIQQLKTTKPNRHTQFNFHYF